MTNSSRFFVQLSQTHFTTLANRGGASSSEAKAETTPVDEPHIDSSDTKLMIRSLLHPTRLKRNLVTEIDELRMETDDHVVETPVPEPSLAAPSVSTSHLPRHRIHGKRGSALKHERRVKPRIELPEER